MIHASAHARAAWKDEHPRGTRGKLHSNREMSTLFSYFKPVQDKNSDKQKSNNETQKVSSNTNGEENENKENSRSAPMTSQRRHPIMVDPIKVDTIMVEEEDDSDDQIGVRKVSL